MKTNRKTTSYGSVSRKKANKGDRIFKILVTVLTVALVLLILSIIAKLNAKPYVYMPSGTDIIWDFENGFGSLGVEFVKENRMNGITADDDESMAAAYAMSDYFEAASFYVAHRDGGDKEEAEKYRLAMEKAREALGEYVFMADKMDKILGV